MTRLAIVLLIAVAVVLIAGAERRATDRLDAQARIDEHLERMRAALRLNYVAVGTALLPAIQKSVRAFEEFGAAWNRLSTATEAEGSQGGEG